VSSAPTRGHHERRSDDDPKITVVANGPYLVSGAAPVRRRAPVTSEHGELLTWRAEAPDETRVRCALCRCGKSAKKL